MTKESDIIRQSSVDEVTELETKPEFLENLVRTLAKSSRVSAQSGIIGLALFPIENPAPQELLCYIANIIRELDPEHATRYGQHFALVYRESTQESNNAALELIKNAVHQKAMLKGFVCEYASLLSEEKSKASDIMAHLETLLTRSAS